MFLDIDVFRASSHQLRCAAKFLSDLALGPDKQLPNGVTLPDINIGIRSAEAEARKRVAAKKADTPEPAKESDTPEPEPKPKAKRGRKKKAPAGAPLEAVPASQEAVEENTSSAPAVDTPAAEDAANKAGEPESAGAPAEVGPMTADEFKIVMQSFGEEPGGLAAVIAGLNAFGHQKISDVAESEYKPIIDKATELMGASK